MRLIPLRSCRPQRPSHKTYKAAVLWVEGKWRYGSTTNILYLMILTNMLKEILTKNCWIRHENLLYSKRELPKAAIFPGKILPFIAPEHWPSPKRKGSSNHQFFRGYSFREGICQVFRYSSSQVWEAHSAVFKPGTCKCCSCVPRSRTCVPFVEVMLLLSFWGIAFQRWDIIDPALRIIK